MAVVLLAACSGSSADAGPPTSTTSGAVTSVTLVPGAGGSTSTSTSTSTSASSSAASTIAPPSGSSSSTSPGTLVPEGFPSVIIEVTQPDGSVVEWCVLLAATPRDRARGLMDVESLGNYKGMLFQFEEETFSSFYMLHTRLPLTVAFIGADGSLVSSTDMDPCPDDDDDPPCPRYAPSAPYLLALEVPQGGLDELGIAPGSTVRALDRPC